MNLSSKERAFLKKLAHNLEPIVRIGKGGMDDDVIESIANVVKKRKKGSPPCRWTRNSIFTSN